MYIIGVCEDQKQMCSDQLHDMQKNICAFIVAATVKARQRWHSSSDVKTLGHKAAG